VDINTGEIYIETHPKDIEWAFKLLRDVLFRKSDELSGASREFYEWLKQWAINKANKKTGFYGSDVRKDNRIHPRTLSRYLQELTDYGLLEITGGNRHKLGYTYKVITNKDYQELQQSIDEQIKEVMSTIWNVFNERNIPPTEVKTIKKTKTNKAVGQV
jgi:hypothetical protein